MFVKADGPGRGVPFSGRDDLKDFGSKAMNKLIKIVGVILITFILASFVLFRFRIGHPLSPPNKTGDDRFGISEMQTVQGEIGTIDPDMGILTLKDGSHIVIVGFDDTTQIVEQGRFVRPNRLFSGSKIRVKYRSESGKNRARYIDLDTGDISR